VLGPVRCLPDHAGEVDAELERHLGLELVLAAAQQQVRPAHAERVHLDQHLPVTADRLRRVGDPDTGRSLG
jgi:hypothetical protein